MIAWSNGGGVQSTAIAILILSGELPKPDYVVIADTSREVSQTWDYLNEIVRPKLQEAGMEIHVAEHSLSTVDLYGHNGDLLLPAFTKRNRRIGRMPTFCSNEWKRRVVQRWLRKQGVKKCDLWLGISTDELHRMKPSDTGWMQHVYPLIDRRMNRAQCLALIERWGWPRPPKSRCYCCPHQTDLEWIELKHKFPKDYAAAIDVEKQILKNDSDVYLHFSGLRLADVPERKSKGQMTMFDGCDSGFCWT